MADTIVAVTRLSNDGVFSEESQAHPWTTWHRLIVLVFIFNPVVARDKPAREMYFPKCTSAITPASQYMSFYLLCLLTQ